mgnify:FL=1|tara:strand:+ start:2587 stop:2868 length:282 start_codon:yes stop_codon:yes gene_type:complete
MDINTKMKEIDNQWILSKNKIIRSFEFKNFVITFDFMKEIAKLAETIHHHPTWTNTYNKLEITLWTHDTGGLSDLDFKMAKKIDLLFKEFNKS